MYDDATLWKLLDGELPAAEGEAVEAAATGDEALRRRIGELRSIKQAILADAPEPPAGFADRVVARVACGPVPGVDVDEARRFLRRMLVAAAILAAVGTAYLLLKVAPDALEPPDIWANPLR